MRKKLNILLSNDDGIYAPGIQSLYDCLSTIANVTVVAPLEEKSATGQTLTLDHPIRIHDIKNNFYGINGFPADCVLMGITHICKRRPDLVISGINRGANLGQDIYYSGTVAAARQAAFHDVPAIAISSVIDNLSEESKEIEFNSAANFVKSLIEAGLHKHISPMSVLNINVPNLETSEISGVEVTNLGRRVYTETVERRLDSRGREYFWIGGKLLSTDNATGSDCWALNSNKVSINPLKLLSDSSEEILKWTELIKGIKLL